MNKIQVLLSSYNGEKYIEEQIKSILKQEGDIQVSILIRDDGSTDNTIKILEKLINENNNIEIYKGENIGPARSFMDLLYKSGDYDYYAFADQDDVWMPNKLISAVNKLKGMEERPSLYISALEIVDEKLNTIEIKKVSGNLLFEGQMIKNLATGCTQVFNKKLCDIIKQYNPTYLIMHDSWITRVCYAIGGNVIVDDNAYIKYRQHSNNVLGYNDEGLQKLKRQFKIAFINNIAMRVNIAKELKKGYESMLTDNTREVIEKLISYQHNRKAKMWLLKNKNFRSNNKKLDRKMKLSIILNKF